MTAVAPGDVVAGIWGHRSEGVVPVEAQHWRRLPAGMEPLHGVFARVGAIALNAVLAAETRVGDQVAVFGQGVIGLLATQLAAALWLPGGGRRRVGCAHRAGRRARSPRGRRRHGGGGAGAAVRELVGPQGADAAIELSGSYRALHEAIRSVGVDGLVVASGFYQGEGIGLRLGEEFHHNRVRLVSSQIGGTPLPLGLRWNQRRLVATVLDEIATGRVRVAPLVTDVLDAADVAEAFALLDAGNAQTLQVVLRFPAAPVEPVGG